MKKIKEIQDQLDTITNIIKPQVKPLLIKGIKDSEIFIAHSENFEDHINNDKQAINLLKNLRTISRSKEEIEEYNEIEKEYWDKRLKRYQDMVNFYVPAGLSIDEIKNISSAKIDQLEFMKNRPEEECKRETKRMIEYMKTIFDKNL